MNYSTPSGRKTASSQIMVGPGALSGVDLTSPESGRVVLTIYDSEDSSLTDKLIISEIEVDAGQTGITHEFFAPSYVNRGIYAELSYEGAGATGSKYIIRYLRG